MSDNKNVVIHKCTISSHIAKVVGECRLIKVIFTFLASNLATLACLGITWSRSCEEEINVTGDRFSQ